MIDSGNVSIEVGEKTKERYQQAKAKMDAADPNLPDMSDDQFMKCMLDTLEAVRDGFYNGQPRNADDVLADMTGRDREEFVPEDIEIPRFEDQEVVSSDE